MATYKAVVRPALEYASSVWSPIASSTSINKLQVMQNAASHIKVVFYRIDNSTHNEMPHETQTYNICITKHYRAPTAQCLTIQTKNVNTQHTSTLQG